MRLTRNFTLAELTVSAKAAELGLNNQPATKQHRQNIAALATFLQAVRDLLGRPMIITSAYRAPAVNRAVGGVANSDHANGLAADFRVDGMAGIEAARIIAASDLKFDQLIWYRPSDVLHVGLGARMRRQVRTNPTTKAAARLTPGLVEA